MSVTQRANQLVLRHSAAPRDVALLRDVVQLIACAALVTLRRIARALRPAILRAAFLTSIAVHSACGDLLRGVVIVAALQLAFLDVFVFPLVLVRPSSRHSALQSIWSISRDDGVSRFRAGLRTSSSWPER